MTRRCFKNFGQGLREGVFLAVATREAKTAFLRSSPQQATAQPSTQSSRAAESNAKPLLRDFEADAGASTSEGRAANATAMARLAAMYSTGNYSAAGSIQQNDSNEQELIKAAAKPNQQPVASERLAQFMHDYS